MTDKPSTGEPVVTLKRCPFCGSAPKRVRPMGAWELGGYGPDRYRISCSSDCWAMSPATETEAEAITAWNTRASHTGDDGLAGVRRRLEHLINSHGFAVMMRSHDGPLGNPVDAILAALTPPSDQRGEG